MRPFECSRGPATAGSCLRGTAGCVIDHHEPTLMEKLAVAEDELRTAERKARRFRERQAHDAVIASAETDVNAKAALCMAAAARCLVTTDHTEA